MSLCNYCQRKETRNRPFKFPNTCGDCIIKIDHHNFNKDDDNDDVNNLIFINSNGKNVYIY